MSGLFIVVAVFRVFFFFSLLCAVSMDSSKVGKCRIACCSCFQGEREPNKNNLTHTHTHTHNYYFQPLKNTPSTHIQQECFLFPLLLWWFSSVHCREQSLHTHFVCFESLMVDLICFPIGLFDNSTNKSVQASALWSRGIDKT